MRSVDLGGTATVYFERVLLTDAFTPATGEAGGQPQTSINGGSWTNNGISVLVDNGYGKYSATLDTSQLGVANGDFIFTRYKGGATLETSGDTFTIGTVIEDPATIAIYGNIQEAELFFSQRLNSNVWDSSTPVDKIKALRQATQIIDGLNFIGCKAKLNQVLQFPRGTDTIIPLGIRLATYLIAFQLLDGYDFEKEANNLAVNMHKYQSVQTYYDRSYIPEHKRAGIPSAEAWRHIRPYVRDIRTITLERVD